MWKMSITMLPAFSWLKYPTHGFRKMFPGFPEITQKCFSILKSLFFKLEVFISQGILPQFMKGNLWDQNVSQILLSTCANGWWLTFLFQLSKWTEQIIFCLRSLKMFLNFIWKTFFITDDLVVWATMFNVRIWCVRRKLIISEINFFVVFER